MAYTSKKRSTVDDPAMKLIDAAAYIGVGRTKFCTLVNTGLLPRGIRLGGGFPVWRRSTLNEFLDKMAAETETVSLTK